MLDDVGPPILSRRAILSSLGGAGLATMLSACGGSKATSIADTVFATNEARNAAATAGSAATTGSAAAGTPAAAGSQTASTATGSSVAATGSGVAGGPRRHERRRDCTGSICNRADPDSYHRRRVTPQAAADAGWRAAHHCRRLGRLPRQRHAGLGAEPEFSPPPELRLRAARPWRGRQRRPRVAPP